MAFFITRSESPATRNFDVCSPASMPARQRGGPIDTDNELVATNRLVRVRSRFCELFPAHSSRKFRAGNQAKLRVFGSSLADRHSGRLSA